MTVGAFFSKFYHRSAGRGQAVAQRITNKSKEVPPAKNRNISTSTGSNVENQTKQLNDEYWKQYRLDEGWGPWFLVP